MTDHDAEIARRFNAGETGAGIADALGLPVRSVESIIRRARKRGLITRSGKVPLKIRQRDPEIIEAWNRGATQTQIARQFGMTKNAVYHTLKRARKQGTAVRDWQDTAVWRSDDGPTLRRSRWRPRPEGTPPPLRHEDPHEPIGCRYVYGDPKGEWRYCQQVKPLGSSWCAKHRAIVFRPASVEDEELAA